MIDSQHNRFYSYAQTSLDMDHIYSPLFWLGWLDFRVTSPSSSPLPRTAPSHQLELQLSHYVQPQAQAPDSLQSSRLCKYSRQLKRLQSPLPLVITPMYSRELEPQTPSSRPIVRDRSRQHYFVLGFFKEGLRPPNTLRNGRPPASTIYLYI